MPELKNPKHEKFARMLSQGHTQIRAYHAAGYVGHNRASAHSIARRNDVRARVEELRSENDALGSLVQQRREQVVQDDGSGDSEAITRSWIEAELRLNLQQARLAGNLSAANKAVELLGRLNGFSLTDKKDKDPNRSNNNDGHQQRPSVAIQIVNQATRQSGDANGVVPPDGTDSTIAITDNRGDAVPYPRHDADADGLSILTRILDEGVS